MLTITIESAECWDYVKEEFYYTKPQTICMEHSLVAIAKWEAKTHKPFLTQLDGKFTKKELEYYFACMTITQNVDPLVFKAFSQKNREQVLAYMNDPMTATWFTNQNGPQKGGPPKKVLTNEVIYALMVELGIPFECQKWHINRLLTLIKVLKEREQPPQKIPHKELMSKYSSLNKQRRAMLHSRG